MESNKKILVFYDGWCPVCNHEINHYKKYKPKRIDFIDIRIENIHKEYSLDPKEIRKHMHSIKDGKIYKGIDTFLLIWNEIPEFKYFKKVFGIKKLRKLYDLGYNLFALHIRPKLLSKKDQWDIK